MNSISWVIYAADVIGNLRMTIGIFAVLAGVVSVCMIIFIVMEPDDMPDGKKWLMRLVIFASVSGVIAALIPGRNTIYAIAASEIGERVATSDAAQAIATDATKALHQWIKSQTTDSKPSKKD